VKSSFDFTLIFLPGKGIKMEFYMKLPRKFSISLSVERCAAQPLARLAIYRRHIWLDGRK